MTSETSVIPKATNYIYILKRSFLLFIPCPWRETYFFKRQLEVQKWGKVL